MKNIGISTIKAIIYFASFSFTIIVFCGVYCIVENVNTPFLKALSSITSSEVIDHVSQTVLSSKYMAKNSQDTMNVEQINYMSIPALGIQIPLKKAVREKNTTLWLQQPSFMHYITFHRPFDENVLLYTLYTKKSFLTIPHGDAITDGMSIAFFDQKGSKYYDFVVNESFEVPYDTVPVIQKTLMQQVLMFVEDDENKKMYAYSLIPK